MLRVEGSRSRLDLLISGSIYIDGVLVRAAVGVEDGKIVWIGKPTIAPPSEKVINVEEGVLVLPGMVDMHVHMRDLQEFEKEDWFTGTSAALAGGVTFVTDMPNNKPPARNLSILELKEDIASRKAVVDYGFYAGLPKDPQELKRMAAFGVLGLKLYPEDIVDEALHENLKEASRVGLLTVVHAEDPQVLEAAAVGERKSFDTHGRIRPSEAEASAVRYLSTLSNRIGFKLHFTHISSLEGLREALEARRTTCATLDTAIHYILLDDSITSKLRGLSKVNPPLRRKDDVWGIRRALRAGLINAVVTDHAPHKLEEKLRESYDEVPPGFPGLEVCLPLLFTLIVKGEISFTALDLYSKHPARILGVPKGEITVGRDADFVFLDTREKWVIKGSNFRSKAKYTPFEGFEAVGKVTKVFVRGVLCYDRGELLVDKGFGKRLN
ncbi:MAG: dihydroorotase family protein, partial [Thermofilaceae archaeon]|nr:dihydroorotase family protein [Thermofilaceae archaeon]